MWSAAPEITLWGGPRPRFEPRTGDPEAETLTTIDHHTSLMIFNKKNSCKYRQTFLSNTFFNNFFSPLKGLCHEKRMAIYHLRPKQGSAKLFNILRSSVTSRFPTLRYATDSVRGTPITRATAVWAQILKASRALWECSTMPKIFGHSSVLLLLQSNPCF